MGPGRARCSGLLFAVAVVRATAVVSAAARESIRSPAPGDSCSAYPGVTEQVVIRRSRQILPTVVDLWLNVQVRPKISHSPAHCHRYHHSFRVSASPYTVYYTVHHKKRATFIFGSENGSPMARNVVLVIVRVVIRFSIP